MFRDYLRAHPEIARTYETEKSRAQDRHPNDSHGYAAEKAAWVRDTEAKRLVWFAKQKAGR